jgi:hypothetical protein
MNMNFADAMRTAMTLTRNQRLLEATRVIQSALSGREPVSSESPSEAQVGRLALENKVIDLTAEVIEPEMMASAELEADTRSEQSKPSKIEEWNAGPLGKALAKLRRTTLPRFSLDGLTVGRPRKALEIPEGAQFLSRSFACAAGSRNYKLYIPRCPQTGRRALLIMLHGGTQDADDFAAGTRMNALAEEHGFIVAYPSQSKAANASLCWTTCEKQRVRADPKNKGQGTKNCPPIAATSHPRHRRVITRASSIAAKLQTDALCCQACHVARFGHVDSMMSSTYTPQIKAATTT